MYLDALKTFDDLISEYGTSSWILEERGDCYDELGLLDKAIEDYSMAIEEADDSDRARCHAVRAQALRSAGRYEEAIEDVQVFIDRYPAKAYGYYARGRCRELLGDREGAMKDYSEGIEIDEDYPYIYLMRGKMYLNNGDKDLAVKDFETVIGKDTIPDNGTCRHYALHFLGRDIEAEEWMEKLIAADPNSSVLWYDKACLLALIGKHDEAVKAFRTSMEKGYRHFVHIEMDSDIDSIRDREDFKTIVTQYQSALASEREIILETTSEETAQSLSEIAMRKMYGGTYEIPCSVNGLPLNMIFDTGASDVSISSVEASFMLKNGYLTEDDVRGSTRYMTASGEILEGTVLRLKEVQVGDAVLKNVDASVVHNQKAPILLGQSVLEKFGTITIDNVNSKLIIKQ